DAADQADLDRLPRLGRREVLVERRFAERADPAEQVELVTRYRRADGVDGAEAAVGRRRARRAAADADRRQLVGAAHVVERARLLDVEDGDAQVAVAREGELVQPLQARIGEEALPVDVGRGGARETHRGR